MIPAVSGAAETEPAGPVEVRLMWECRRIVICGTAMPDLAAPPPSIAAAAPSVGPAGVGADARCKRGDGLAETAASSTEESVLGGPGTTASRVLGRLASSSVSELIRDGGPPASLTSFRSYSAMIESIRSSVVTWTRRKRDHNAAMSTHA